jgi:predicted permease
MLRESVTRSSEPAWRRYLTFWRSSVDRDVDSELRFHFDERVADLIARGRAPAQARAEAEAEFGDQRLYREQLRAIDGRIHDRRSRTQWLEVVATDLRYAIRGMRRAPGLTAAIVVILALGVGANATMFGLIDRLLLRAPEHIVDPDRVVLMQYQVTGQDWVQTTQPYVFRTVMAEGVTDFSGVTVATPTAVVRRTYYPVGRGTEASRAAGALVGSNYFAVLGVHPELGRLFTPGGDTTAVPERVAVLGHGYWKRAYGGRRDVLGQRIQLGAETFTIIGVLPAGFTGTEMRDVDVWLPLVAAGGLRFAREKDWMTSQNSQWLLVIARLKPGADERHARAQATLALRNWNRSQLKSPSQARLARIDSLQVRFTSVIPGRSTWEWGTSGTGSDVRITKLLMAASTMLLLMACANITNLLLVRALSRRREIAVRLSLGISRPRLITQLLVEGLTVTSVGVAGALVVAAGCSQIVRRWLIGEGAVTSGVVDGPVLAFTILVGLATGIIATLVPAFQASRADLSSALKSGTRLDGLRGSRLRDALLVAQGAVAIVLLAGAALFVQSLKRANAVDVGLDVDRMLMARIDQGMTGLQPAETRALFDEFVRRAEAVPGISEAALASPIPFGGSWSTSVYIPGRAPSPNPPTTFQYFVTPKYFSVAGIRTILGRVFSDGDRVGSTVVVNQALARVYWPGRNPVGQCMKLDADTMPCATIIGVVSDTHRQDLVEATAVPQVYRPIPRLGDAGAGSTPSFLGYTLVARTTRDAAPMTEALHRALQAAGPVPYAHVQTLRQAMGNQSRNWQLGARVFGVFAILALLLAGVGLFSVVAFSVGQRMYEFGIRKALGARPEHLARLTIVRGLSPAVGGIAAGIALVLVLGRFLDGLLFQVSARDPRAFAAATGILLLSAAAASLIPAVRASRADPRSALNAE